AVCVFVSRLRNLCRRGNLEVVSTTDVAEQEDVVLAEALFQSLGSVRRQVRRTAGRPLPSPLSGSQIELVRLVRRTPGITVSEAADELRLAGNTVSTLVRQLTGAGVLRREADPADRRVARL